MMKNKITVLLILITSAFNLNAQATVDKELQSKWDKENEVHNVPLLNYRPSHLPDRVIITPLESDNEVLAFTWRTDTSESKGRVEIIEGDHLRYPKDNRVRIDADNQILHYKDYPMLYHTAKIDNLKPGKIYKYRVGYPPHWSPWYTYKHHSFNDTVSFLYFGDTQNGILDHSRHIYKDALKNFSNSKITIYAGDMINHANNDYEWAEWHSSTEDINSSMPVIATPGNHEYLKNLEGKKVQLSSYWTKVFQYPYKWDAGQFYFDYGFVRFIVLNSNEEIFQQGIWLDNLLSETEKDWVVILTHHPVFSGAEGRINKGLQENWKPIIKKHRDKVALVLQGHDHTYARGGFEDRNGTKSDPSQPVFILSVVGDKYYTLEPQDWMDVSYDEVSSYQFIEITKESVYYRAFSETNTLIDEFQITK